MLHPTSLARLLLLAAVLALPALAHAQLWLDSIKGHLDSQTATLLFPIPDSLDGSSRRMRVSIDADSGWETIKIGESKVASGDILSIDIAAAGAATPLSVSLQDSSELQLTICFTTLPVVHLYGTFSSAYAEGIVDVCTTDTADTKTGKPARIKWRGASTNSGGKHKHNYHIKFLSADGSKKNRRFFGLRKDNDWLLDAAQIDFSRCRNAVLAQLWADMATPPYYAQQEPDARTSVRSRPVELFLNDTYQGIYHLSEAMDRKQLQLMDYDTLKAEHHGLLYKAIAWTRQVYMSVASDLPAVGDQWQGYEIKYPDPDDVTPNFAPLQEAVAFVANSSDETFREEVERRFDVPALIDYYIFMHLVMGVDNIGKNLYWAIHDQAADPRITPAVWDLDATIGLLPDPTNPHPDNIGPLINFEYEWNPQRLFIRLWEDAHFNPLIVARYNELRSGLLNAEELIARFNSYAERFDSSGATEREQQRWSGDTDLAGRELNLADEFSYITNWITQRIPYLDAKIFIPDALPVTMPQAATPARSAIYRLDGTRVSPASATGKGVYIINGRKVVK